MTPIHKKGEQGRNYRPISLMSVLAKVIEKIVFEQTYEYVTSKNILFENQSGFRSQHSTGYSSLFRRFVIPKVRLIRRFVIPKVRYSEGSLFRRFVIPKLRLSENEIRFVNPKMK